MRCTEINPTSSRTMSCLICLRSSTGHILSASTQGENSISRRSCQTLRQPVIFTWSIFTLILYHGNHPVSLVEVFLQPHFSGKICPLSLLMTFSICDNRSLLQCRHEVYDKKNMEIQKIYKILKQLKLHGPNMV